MTARGYVAGALVALVLIVVPLALASPELLGGRTEPGRTAPPEPEPLATDGDPAAATALTCDDEAEEPRALPLTGTLEAARLCATHPRYRRWTAPEPLSQHLDVLAAGLARLEPAPEDYLCFQSSGGFHYDLRLLVDGRVVSLATQPSCLELTAGGTDYLNSDEPFDAYLEALARQRSEREPPPLRPTTALDCTATPLGKDHALSPLGDPQDMVEAVSCWRPDTKGDVLPWKGAVPVPPPALAALVAEMRANPRRDIGFDDDPCAGKDWYWQDLLGRTAWGDVVAVRGVCDTFLTGSVDATEESQTFWSPSSRSQRILDRLRR